MYRDEYGKKSEENSIRTIVKVPVRGYVYDRKGNLLVDNRPSYTVMLTPIDFDAKNISLLASILQMDEESIKEKVKKGRQYSLFNPVRIKRDIEFATLSALEENKSLLPGVEVQIESKRYYGTPAHASHMLGYAKEISDLQLEKFGEYYQQGDVVGSAGLEAKYEKYLRGEKGFEFISQNSRGQVIGNFNNGKYDIPPKDGLDLHLAIDTDVQALAESLLTGHRGAVVAIDPDNGGVIALASKPDYDLSDFSGVTSPEVWKKLNDDEDKPLFNRATLTRYPPGSTFKMILAIAALENHVIDENWRVQCRGYFVYGKKVFKDEHVHGSTNIVEAIQRSCNVFFYQLMLKVGLDPWSEYAKEFGFGQPTKIDILEENSGLLPSTEYYNRVYGKGKWTQGYLVSLGIGQGEIGVTPLQMASYASMLGNKGHYFQPPYCADNLQQVGEYNRHRCRRASRYQRFRANVANCARRNAPGCDGTGWDGRSRTHPRHCCRRKNGNSRKPARKSSFMVHRLCAIRPSENCNLRFDGERRLWRIVCGTDCRTLHGEISIR